jgi:hypothetical protein
MFKAKPQRIKPPKFRVGRYVLNEYELRKLQLDVCNGIFEPNFVVKDEAGNTSTIRPDGILTGNLHRFNLSSQLAMDLIFHETKNAKLIKNKKPKK